MLVVHATLGDGWASAGAREPTGKPRDLRAFAAEAGITLRWNASDDAASVFNYRILRHRPEEGEPEPLVYLDYTHNRSTSYTDTAVQPGTLYVYRVQAADQFGHLGEASAPASARVPRANRPTTASSFVNGKAHVGEKLTSAAPSTIPPTEPRNLELSPVAVESDGVGIKVSWDTPSGTGDSDITGYHVQWRYGNEDYAEDQTTRRVLVTDSFYTIDTTSRTTTGDELTVRVAAANGARAGPWSEKTGWLPSHNDLELWLLMEKYGQERRADFPWVLETLNYLDANEVPVKIRSDMQDAGLFYFECPLLYEHSDNGLRVCSASSVEIKRWSRLSEQRCPV